MPAYPLTAAGLLCFSGADAGAFLQGQLTSDVNALAAGRSQYSGYCTPKGRLLASFLLWRDADAYWMHLPAVLAESVRKRLAMYILRAKVQVADRSAEYACVGLSGAGATALVERLAGSAPSTAHACVNRGKVTVIRLPVDRYLVIVPRAEAESLVALPAKSDSAAGSWESLDILAGVPVIMPGTQEEFVPQMVNFDLIGAVSYAKGCYPGQEIVARTHYLGRLKQRMFLAHVSAVEAPRPGDRLYSEDLGEQASGMVVNAAPAGPGGYDLLAVMQIASAAAHPVHWKAQDGPVLSLRQLPYPVPA